MKDTQLKSNIRNIYQFKAYIDLQKIIYHLMVLSYLKLLYRRALDLGELTASMPDANGYITIRGGAGLAAPGTPVVLFNRTKSITVTITAEEDGSFSGTIRADLGDKIEVHVKDLLDNVTILDPGIFQNPDGTAAVGPDGGTINGPGGITTYIPEGAFDEFIAIKVTMVSEDVLKDVTIDPALRSAGVFQVDTGGVRANKELKISVPAPEWITPDHQVLITKVVNIRGFDELTLTCPALLQDGSGEQGRTIISTSPPFDGIYEGGTYGLTTWYNPETGVGFAMVETWSYYGAGYSLGEYGFSFAAPEHKRKIFPITVPVNKPYNVDLNSLDGTVLDSVSIQGPPKRGEFIEGIIKLTDDTVPPVVWNVLLPDGVSGVLPSENYLTIEMSEEIDPESVNSDTVYVTDSEGHILEGEAYLAEDGKTIVFVPRYGYKYGETYTMHINGIKDWGGNVITEYTSSFSTFLPHVIKTVPVPFAMAIDKFGNYVAVKGDDGMSLGIGLTRASFIEIFDVSDPLNPVSVGRQDLWGYMKDIKVVPDMGDYIVAVGGRADKEGFLDLINVTDPYNPAYHEGIYISWNPNYSSSPPEGVPFQGGSPAEVAVIGTNAYIANFGLGIQAVDLTAVTPPFETAQRNAIGGTITANSYSSVSKVRNNILAVKNGALQVLSPGLSVLGELSGLNWPGVVAGVERFPIDIDGDRNYGSYEDEDGDPTTSLQEEFDLALVTTSDGIVVIDVTTPSAPIKMDMIPISAWKIEVDRDRRMAFGLSGGGLSIISLRDIRPGISPQAMGLRDADKDNIDDRVLYTITEASGMDMALSEQDGLFLAYVADYSGGKMKVVHLNQPRVKVEATPSLMSVVESLDSGEFICKITPTGLSGTNYTWIWEAPSGAGNNPNVNFKYPNNEKTIALTTRWFAYPDDRHWTVTGESSAYKINCKAAISGTIAQGATSATLTVTVDPTGQTSWPQFAGDPIISTRTINDNVEWYVSGQGTFRRTVPVKTLNLPATSQFYNKVDAHESKHVAQWTSESPWQDLWDANKLYNDVLSELTSAVSVLDLINKISSAINIQKTIDRQKAIDTKCDREIAAFRVDRGVEPHYLELDDNEVPEAYKCTPTAP